jgi:hypothetical protein
MNTQHQATTIFQRQQSQATDLDQSFHFQNYKLPGWALRQRKHANPVADKIKDFIKKTWLESQEIKSKLSAEIVQHQIRTSRTSSGEKLFKPHEYPTVNQIKYQFRKLAKNHSITAKQQLIDELLEAQKEKKQ